MTIAHGIDATLDKLTVNVSPCGRGRIHQGGSISDDIVALSRANYGKEDGVASEGGGEGHHDFVIHEEATKKSKRKMKMIDAIEDVYVNDVMSRFALFFRQFSPCK